MPVGYKLGLAECSEGAHTASSPSSPIVSDPAVVLDKRIVLNYRPRPPPIFAVSLHQPGQVLVSHPSGLQEGPPLRIVFNITGPLLSER